MGIRHHSVAEGATVTETEWLACTDPHTYRNKPPPARSTVPTLLKNVRVHKNGNRRRPWRSKNPGLIEGAVVERYIACIELFHLNQSPAIDTRRTYLRILRLKNDYPFDREVHRHFLESFGFPEDLPNLEALRPPGGNTLRESTATCYFAFRARGALAEIY